MKETQASFSTRLAPDRGPATWRLLRNAVVLGHPRATAILVRNEWIAAVGAEAELQQQAGGVPEPHDCGGRLVTPGLHDAHTHLFALAANLSGVDCAPAFVSSEAALLARLRAADALFDAEQWLVGYGLEPFSFQESAAVDRWLLDAIERPLVLHHRGGHLSILNSAAIRALDLEGEGVPPVDGVVERDEHGSLTGRLFELSGWLRARLPSGSAEISKAGIENVLRDYLQRGVTAVQDASPGNGLRRWKMLCSVRRNRALPRLTMMIGARRLEECVHAGLQFATGENGIRAGHVKIMLHETTGALHPDPAELARQVQDAHHAGFPVAIHTIGLDPLRAALRALAQNAPPRARDRLEHVSVCPPEEQARIASMRLGVAGQPNFIYESGDRYLATVPKHEQPWLYPTGMLLRRGVVLAAATDAPVAAPDPRFGMYGAVTRKSRSDTVIYPRQTVSRLQAIAIHTHTPARLSPWDGQLGRLSTGYLADLVIWNEDLRMMEDHALLDATPYAVMVGGEFVL